MTKATISTFDKDINVACTKATLFTVKEKYKLKKNELHTPGNAKLIVENEEKIFAFILVAPIIQVDSDGNVNVFTSSPSEKVTMKESYIEEGLDIKEQKLLLKAITAKEKTGLSLEEVQYKNQLISNIEISILVNKKVPFEIGGGF